ncbi:MAG: surface carbohydrate biosynthesis protein, partial [Alphaproteobacteria bacterium]
QGDRPQLPEARGVIEPKQWILLPIETKARELHAKLLLAAMAVERGYGVVLGEQNAMVRQLAHLPRGLYVDKSIASSKTRHFKRLRRLGYRVAAWCEEGLVYRDRETYLHQRISMPSLAEVERFFCWGEVQQADLLEKAAASSAKELAKLVATGNPRFDLLRPGYRDLFAEEAQELRERHGDFILINTNFARYNHFHGEENLLKVQRERGNVQMAEQEAFLVAWRDFLGELYHAFAAMLEPLSRTFPQRRIILRPHPSENHQRWQRECEGLDNVTVAFRGNVVPWLQAAKVSIHNSCTTGVEAYLLDRPVISYQPVCSEVYDSHLPNAVSHRVCEIDPLIQAVGAALAGEEMNGGAEGRRTARQYITAMDGREASELVLDVIGETNLDLPQPSGLGHRLGLASGHLHLPALNLARRILRPRTAAYIEQKFPDLTLCELRRELRRMHEASGRFSGVRVAPLAYRCYSLTGDSAHPPAV